MMKFFLVFFVVVSKFEFFDFGDKGESLVSTKSSGSSSSIQWPSNISIGFMISAYSKKLYNLTCQLAIGYLKQSAIIPGDLKINIYWRNASDDVTAMNSSLDLYKNRHVDVFFGPETSVAIAITALLASDLDIPTFGYMSVSSDLENKQKYTTLIRTVNSISFMSQAVRAILLYYNWNRVVIVRLSGLTCDIFTGGFPVAFSSTKINIVSTLMVNYNDTNSINSALTQLKLTARIAIVCGSAMTPDSAVPFLSAAYKNGMSNPDYVYIVPEYNTLTSTPWEPWLQPGVTDDDAAYYQQVFQSVVTVKIYGFASQNFKNFSSTIANTVVSSDYYQDANYTPDANFYLSSVHDATYLYGLTLNKTISQQLDFHSGINIMNAAKSTTFDGSTGPVTINNNSEKVPKYKAGQLQVRNSTITYFMNLGPNPNLSNMYSIQVLSLTTNAIWGTADNKPIPDVPVCGFNNEFCKKSYTLWYIVGTVIVIALIGAITGGAYYYKKQQYEAALFQSLWKVDMKLFQYISHKDKSSRSQVASVNLESQSTSLNGSAKGEGIFEPSRNGNSATAVGSYKGTLCIARRGVKSGRITLSMAQRSIFVVLKTIKEISHDNLNLFVGLSVDEEEYFYTLWVYCPRGSLDNVLFNSEIRIDETFQVSLIRDIISGLAFLHDSPIGYHGRLYAKNCVVDGRWVAKISEFGMFHLIQKFLDQKAVVPDSEPTNNEMLCTAPEILRKEKDIDYKLADIYQVSIIAYKILYRREPFDDYTAPATEILSQLKTLDFNGRPLRPILKQVQGFDLKFLNSLEMGWRENPRTRPTSASLKKEIFLQTQKYGKNLIDHVMNMLEKYATNLEKVVEERTEKMNEERRRADNLLYQILPKIVADALKVGQTVDPEIFETASIYFSDIVGFTNICSASKPGEIVVMLNGLYSQFDQVILDFDAYKVETIGDAYLVVSGVPVRNGMQHVTNIAEMSLKILQVLKQYRIPHMPFTPVNVRIGLHSGSVAGGVVGVTMPRYCLFGDAVNFASRMESTGESNKIHISENMYVNLSVHETFVMERRGEIEVKGKGMCTTYWLLGHKE